MRLFRSIRFKFSVTVIALLAATFLMSSAVIFKTLDDYIENEVLKRAEAVSRSAAASAAHSIISDDMLGLDSLVLRIKQTNPDIEYIAVVDNNMKILAHNDIGKRGSVLRLAGGENLRNEADGTRIWKADGPHGEFFQVDTPVYFQGRKFGGIVLSLSKSVLLSAQLRAKDRVLKGFIIITLFGIAGIVLLLSFITKPIKELASGVRDLMDGKRSRPLKVYSGDELGALTSSFNRMAEEITYQKESLGKYSQRLEEAYLSTVRALAAAIDARDSYTHSHSTRVAALSLKLGQAAGMSRDELLDLEIACLFHDLGKLKTPDYILLKAGPLSADEEMQMMKHAEQGAEIISKSPALMKYVPAVRHHHEWYNGTGYPDRLAGDQIPFTASIIAIADAFDAMTSKRPYRKPLSVSDALQELDRYAGEQFNPALVKLFVDIYQRGNGDAELREAV